jgi:thioredoxin reductase (NADPH)
MIGQPEKSAIFGHRVENYFGIPMINGDEMVNLGIEQAESFGTELLREDVVRLERIEEGFKVVTDHDTELVTKVLILAPGISREKLGAEGEKEY